MSKSVGPDLECDQHQMGPFGSASCPSGIMFGVLVVVSGLPCSGKSSLADALGREFQAAVLSVDPIEAAIWRCGIPVSFETGVAAYEVVAVLAEHQLRLGLTAIVDAVSSVEVARDMWRRAAERTMSSMRVIEIICSDADLHRRRLAERRRGIDGFGEPSWAEVEARRGEWEPWTVDHLVLDTVGSLDENVALALEYLRPKEIGDRASHNGVR